MWRTTIFAVAVVTVVFVIPVHAQNNVRLDKSIVIHAKQVRFDSLLSLLSKTTGFKFSFNPNAINQAAVLKVPGNITANKWLSIFKVQFRLEHKVVGEHIILSGMNKAVASARQVNRTVAHTNIPKKTRAVTNTTEAYIKTAPKKKTRALETLSPDTISAIDIKNGLHKSDVPVSRAVLDTASKELQTTAVSTITPLVVADNNTGRDTASKASNIISARQKAIRFPVQNITRTDVGLQGIGAGFERGISNKLAVDISAGVGGIYSVANKVKYRIGIYNVGAYMHVNPRWYYRGVKHETLTNDGAYLGFMVQYVHDLTKVKGIGSVMLFNLHWGIQKKLTSRWLMNAHAGPGFALPTVHVDGATNEFYPSVALRISYRMNASKR